MTGKYGIYSAGRVNQRVQHYEKFLKKTSFGVKKLSFSLGLALMASRRLGIVWMQCQALGRTT